MRGVWRCSGSVGLLVSAMLAQSVSANREGYGEYEVHWGDKDLNIFQHVKRKAACQVDGWMLCPSSVGGGCCPPNFECGTASCYATAAGPTSCNGEIGYYNCPLTLGPGSCCPVGYNCNDSSGCDPPADVSVPPSCPESWIGCAVELGGGCCRSGQVCGSGVCYNTTPKTFSVSETKTTTDSRGQTTITVVTSLTVITDGPNTSSGSSGSATVVGVAQLVPSTVAKLPDTLQTSDSSGGGHGGLSSGALGGIITVVIVVLVAVIVAATFIVMRLKKAERAARDAEKAAESGHGSSTSPAHSHKSGFEQTEVHEIASATYSDPLHFPIMTPSPHLRSRSATIGTLDSSPSHTPNFTHSETSSPPLFSMPFNYPPSEASDDNTRVGRSRGVSVDSEGTYRHTRQPSDLSELDPNCCRSELEASENNEAAPQRRSNSTTQSGRTHVRKNSDLSGQNRTRGDSNTGTLGTVNEIFDFHGYYGPPHTLAGQTAANLSRGPSSASAAPSSHRDT